MTSRQASTGRTCACFKAGASFLAASLVASASMIAGFNQPAFAVDVTNSEPVKTTIAPDVTSDIAVEQGSNFAGLKCAADKDVYSLAFVGNISVNTIGQRLEDNVRALFEAWTSLEDSEHVEVLDATVLTGSFTVSMTVGQDVDINAAGLTTAAVGAAHDAANPGNRAALALRPTAVSVDGKKVRVTYGLGKDAPLVGVIDALKIGANLRVALPAGTFSMTRTNVEKGTNFTVSGYEISGSLRSTLSHKNESHTVGVDVRNTPEGPTTLNLNRKITPAVSVMYVSGTANKDLPAELVNKAPGRVDYPTMEAKPKAPAAPAEKTLKVTDGTWTFTSYRPAATAAACGVSFYEGVWTFTSDSTDDQGTQPSLQDAPKTKEDNASKVPNDNKAQKGQLPEVTVKKVDQAKTEPAHQVLARTGFGAGIVMTGAALLIAGAAALVVRRRA